jgi:hypothetical protein
VHRYPGMAVLVIVIPEELPAEDTGVLDRAESSRESRAVFECLVVNTNVEGGCGSSLEAVLYGRWRFAGPPEPLCGERF